MKRSVQLAATATLAALLLGGGVNVAQAATTNGSNSGIDAYSVPADEMATATSWSSERMQAAIPADTLTEDQIAAIDVAVNEAVAAGAPTVVHGQPALPSTHGQQTTAANGNSRVTPMAQVAPISHIGKVFFTLNGRDFVCSANSVVSANENTVSTAGHCLNAGPGAFATEFVFVPAYENGRAPYGQWFATDLFAPTQWTARGDMNYDTGFAVVDGPGSASLADTVGASGVAFNQPRNQYYTLYGYPAAYPFNGETLNNCAGTARTDTFGGSMSQGVSCNMTGGSSGGPWFLGTSSRGLQNSVNSFGYTAIRNVMWGPYWGSVIQSTYQAAQAS